MKRSAVATTLAFVLAASAFTPIQAAEQSPDPAGCRVSRGQVGNDGLKAITGDGRFIFKPGGAGFVDRDGALGIKFAWIRGKKGHLEVGGRRLDGPAGPARAYIYDYGDHGFQPTYLIFPTPGCWEITGRVADASVTFVVFVEKIGDGPYWHMDGPEKEWRVTSLTL